MRKLLIATLVATLTMTTLAVGVSSAQQVDPSICSNDDKILFYIEYNDGVDTGCVEDKDIDRFDVPGLLANNLHLSCSDDFIGTGTTEKSNLGDPNRYVVSYTIYEVKDGRINKLKCSGGGSGGGLDILDGRIDTTYCDNDSKMAFLIEYNDTNVVGVDSGCADSNEVDRSDIPDLIARELHVSCSDDFIGVGTTEKSDLGDPNRFVVAYSIWKLKDGQIEELKCGQGTPIPGGGIAGFAVVAAAIGGAVLYSSRRRTQATAA